MTGRFNLEQRTRAAATLKPTSSTAAARLRDFVEQGGAVVTTGQQAGLFSGPLYTIYKALTAARLSQALERELGGIVLPVFWTASEDHDWEEVNHVDLLDRSRRLTRLRLSGANEPARSMSRYHLGPDINRILDDAGEVLAGHSFSDDYLKLIRRAYQPGATMAAGFNQVLLEILAPFDMLLADAADPALKDASKEILRSSLMGSAEEERVLRERSGELEGAGYHSQVGVLPNATNVFFEGKAGRERIYRRGEQFVLPESETTFTVSDLNRILEEDPGSLSPNVFLRPVVESAVFPVLTYVAGPGEASYFAQIGPLFELHGMKSPIVSPRASLVLLEPQVGEALKDLGLAVEEISRPRHELLTHLARPLVPGEVKDALFRLRQDLSRNYHELIEAALHLDPNLAGALGSIRNWSLAGAGRAERKILSHAKKHNGEMAARLDLVLENLYPCGAAQERTINILPYLVRHGPDLLERIAETIDFPWLSADAKPDSSGNRAVIHGS